MRVNQKAAGPAGDQTGDRRAFAGIKVLDLTRVLAGPFCAYQLALLGAEVIKIEPPGRGETVRWRTESDPSFGQQGMSLGFMTQSSNKRFLALDLNKAEGRDIFLKLAAECDVVVQNLRSGSAEKRGIGYAAVKAVNHGSGVHVDYRLRQYRAETESSCLRQRDPGLVGFHLKLTSV